MDAGLDCCSNFFNDTWVWDGTTWTQRFPATSPPARFTVSLAYDAQRGEVVLFGGKGITGQLNDTWTWDGTTWTEQHPSTVPSSVRDELGLAYDAQRGEVVMFGGYQGCFGCYFDDTWTWDGVTWTQEFPTRSPSVRAGMGMVYDTLRGQVVLFGGSVFPTVYNDTWTWDGSNWQRESPPAKPPARAGLAMAYDEVRGNTVIFGGAVYLESSTTRGIGTGQPGRSGSQPPPRPHAARRGWPTTLLEGGSSCSAGGTSTALRSGTLGHGTEQPGYCRLRALHSRKQA